LNELEQDDMMPYNPLHLRFMHEYKQYCHENNFKAESYFLNHIDQEIADRAAQLISSPYTLSRGFKQKGSSDQIEQNVVLDQLQLQEMVYVSVLELKYTIIELELEKLEKQLSQTQDDWNKVTNILIQQRQFIQMRKQLAQALGRQ
jgi:DNA primase